MKEKFEDIKGLIKIRISKKNRQHSGQKKNYKKTNNDLQQKLDVYTPVHNYICKRNNSFVKTGFSEVLLLVEQELLSLSEQLSSPSVLSRVHVVQSLVFGVVFCGSLFTL
jgi:hypothetical protein